MRTPGFDSVVQQSRESALATIIGADFGGLDFLEAAILGLIRGLDCRAAGFARLLPGGDSVETLVLHGGGVRRTDRRYRLGTCACRELYRPAAESRYLYRQQCTPKDVSALGFVKALGPLSYRGEAITDSAGRPIAHVFALADSKRPDCAEDRMFFRLIAQRAGAEYRRMLSDAARRETETRFRNLIEGSAQGVVIHHGLKPLFANESYARIFGYEAASDIVALDSLLPTFAPSERERLARFSILRLHGQTLPEQYEFQGVRQDGAVIWLSATARTVEWDGSPAVQCSLTDITARKQAELDRAQLAAIVDCSNNAIIGRRLDGTIFSWNAAAERLYGYSAGEAIGSPITMLHPEGLEAEAKEATDAVLRGETVVEQEMVRQHKDGPLIPIVASLSPVRDASGAVVGLSSISRDRSQHEQMERDLRHSRALLRHAQRLGRIGWWSWHVEERRITLSAEACKVLGLEPGKRLGATLESYGERFVHETDRAQVTAAIASLGPQRPVVSCRHRTLKDDGGLSVVHLWCEATHDGAGELKSISGIVQDVTEIERYREALELSEARFRDVTEVTSDWVWETDASGRFEYVSDQILAITGFPRAHYLGLTWPDCIDDWYSGEPNMLAAETASKRSFRDLRVRIATRHGREAWVAVSGKPRLDAGGRFLGFRGAVSDHTAQVAAEDALRQAKDLAESANDTKSHFLAAASHDLRQPLHALRLLVSVLARTSDPGKREAITAEIGSGLSSMTSILNALLDVSELDSGGVKPEIAEVALDELFSVISLSVSARAKEKGLRFSSVESGARVRSDPVLLSRIVENFLVNAAQYTERGRILLGCRRRGGRIRIEVWDSGPGIPADRLDVIFEEFQRLADREGDAERGLGLGLAIVQRLAELLDHPIDVKSWPGRGSMFAVELPLVQGAPEQPARAAPRPSRALDLSGHLVVLIENATRVRDATQQLLEAWGAQVVPTSSAEAALLQLVDRQRPPDLVITDLQLPRGVDGLGAIAAIESHFGRSVPAVVLTGEPSSARLREVRRAGLPVLRKPASAESIQRAIDELLQERMAAE